MIDASISHGETFLPPAVQPAVDNLLPGDVGIVVVAGAYGRALDAQFTFLVDTHGHALQRQSDGANLVSGGRIDA